MAGADLVVVSNRGPLSFDLDDAARPVPAGSAGGLAAALHPLLAGSGATWVACAMSEADRAADDAGLMAEDGLELHTVRPDADTYRMAYDVVSNSTLWFLHHHLFDLSHRPRLDGTWARAWDAYVELNEMFGRAVSDVAAQGATVLVQDYHLCLVPALLRRERPDLRSVHFSHTPFADPGVMRVLPAATAGALLAGMAAARSCGFHTARWEWAYRACCADMGIDPGRTFVSPLVPDAGQLASRVAGAGVTAARRRLDDMVGDRPLIVRVDRLEPSKNLLRGFWAFDELLRSRPDLRGRVVMLALAYKSRQSLVEYLAYGNEVEHAAARINDTWRHEGWEPVVFDVADNPDRSLAALTRYDVLLVNPLRDGLNLVAKEGPLVNETDGVLALSREAGAFEELRGPSLELNPFDLSGTAAAMAEALDMDGDERRRRADALKELVSRRKPVDWLADLLAAAG
ncbi:MAG TPA: trehalose-6-phosphate synthase [Acidimicrobiales bacterium]|nr:trehalose-6-phosphate synthase [Acidimicrobiales bacterium]